MPDRVTANLPSRDFDRTEAFYAALGFAASYKDAQWMILRRGPLEIEFFPFPDLEPPRAEVVGRDPRERRFIGDMPHAWISSDYIRSALELFAYRREHDEALVIAAGVPVAWLDEGVTVRGLRTAYGVVSYSLRRTDQTVTLQIEGDAPPGGFVLPWPYAEAPRSARFNGAAIARRGDEYVLPRPGQLVVTLAD